MSPLRYPGAKRRLAPVIGQLLVANGLRPKLYVEPFAGGASVALQLLGDDLVDEVGLGELDPLLAGFWRCVFWDTDWLIRWVQSVAVTLGNWRRYKTFSPTSDRGRARRCFFLNRTSFSGIIGPTGGPIGGMAQKSDYKVSCRFPRKRLVKRIREIGRYRDRVAFVRTSSWKATVGAAAERHLKPEDLFFYFDPPFYNKADRLYACFFDDRDHEALAAATKHLEANWLVSYDPSDFVVGLYRRNGVRPRHVEMLYCAGMASQARPELIITNLAEFPFERGHRTYSRSASPKIGASGVL